MVFVMLFISPYGFLEIFLMRNLLIVFCVGQGIEESLERILFLTDVICGVIRKRTALSYRMDSCGGQVTPECRHASSKIISEGGVWTARDV